MEAVMEDWSRVKVTRTKRQRLDQPSLAAVTAVPLLAAATAVPSSPTYAELFENMIKKVEEMSNFLTLLAQGSPKPEPNEETTAVMKLTSRRFAEAATTTGGKDAYACKDCSKCYPSYQALGGHRASHKKMKISIPVASVNETTIHEPTKVRIHQCVICGAEFNSGQALGGHMRRHRPTTIHEPALAFRLRSKRQF